LYEKHDDKPWKFLMINIGFCPCFSPMYFLTNPFETRWGRSGHHHLTFRGRSWGSQGWFQGNLTRNNGFYNYRIHIICIYIYRWWLTYPSEKYENQLGWLFPIYGKIKFMFQSTNQKLDRYGNNTIRW
jgi:hypothetical protein